MQFSDGTDKLRGWRGSQAKAARLPATTEPVFKCKVRQYAIDAARFRA